MKLRLLILLMTYSNICFGMRQEEIDPEIFKNLPLEAKFNVLVQTLELDKTKNLYDNFFQVLPDQIKRLRVSRSQRSAHFQRLIEQKVAELFKNNFSQQQINKEFSDTIEIGLRTPALSTRQQNFAKVLLKAGADIDDVGQFGSTLLMSAILKEKYDIAKFLIDNGANINTLGNVSPLTLAIRIPSMNERQLVRLLLDKGADLKRKIDGETPLELAKRLGRTHIAKMIEDKMNEK